MLTIPFPNINPYIIKFGEIGITWYALGYVVGILIGWQYGIYVIKKTDSKLTVKQLDDYITWLILSIVIGGRLGFVFLYEPEYYLLNPVAILETYKGGMAFHGGLLGVILSSYIFTKYYNIKYSDLADILAQGTPPALFLVRIANFINGELYGKPTDMPWGVVFPNGGDIPRHPSQIYEALLEGLVLFFIIQYFSFIKKAYKKPYFLSGIFLLFYGLARCFSEFFRVPDFEYWNISSGQLYSLPMIILGLYFIFRKNGHQAADISSNKRKGLR